MIYILLSLMGFIVLMMMVMMKHLDRKFSMIWKHMLVDQEKHLVSLNGKIDEQLAYLLDIIDELDDAGVIHKRPKTQSTL